PGPVGGSTQLPEHVSRLPVDADPAHAVDRVRLFDAANLVQRPGRGDEEAHDRTADAVGRRELARRHGLAEGGGDGERIRVDAERNAAELAVVAAADARRDLRE